MRRPKRPRVWSWLRRTPEYVPPVRQPYAASPEACRQAESYARQLKVHGRPYIVPPSMYDGLRAGGCDMTNIVAQGLIPE